MRENIPPPSRLVFLLEMREGDVTAIRETAALTAGFLADHPELTVSDEAAPGFYRSTFIASRKAAGRTTPALDAFNQSRNQRAQLISRLQYLSPAMIAGGDVARNMAFQDQARAALNELSERIGPAVVTKQRLSVADIAPYRRLRSASRCWLKKRRRLGRLMKNSCDALKPQSNPSRLRFS